ncbi:MAG: AAA family ATPase, partial [Myxococcota bacterium]
QARGRVERRAAAEESELTAALREIGEDLGLNVERGDDEVHVAAVDGDEPDEASVRAITVAVEEFEEQLVELGERVERELRQEVERLMLEAVRTAFEPVIADFEGSERIGKFLEDVHALVNREIRGLVDEHEESGSLNAGIVVPTLLTEHVPNSGAPVVEVAYPTVSALFGRSHVPPDSGFPPEPGFAVPGALHKANGGYLIIPARTLLKNGVYEQLKACLLSGRFIPPEHDSTYFRGTVEELLFPQIPIDVKVVLVASPALYQELHEADPEFSQLFKVQARFAHTFQLEEALQTYPAFLAGFLAARGLPPLTAAAVAELIHYGCRLVESRTKATAQLGLIAEVASEAAYLGRRAGGGDVIDDAMVRRALEAKQWRSRFFQDEVQRLLSDGTIRIEVDGAKVGQVNAISVLSDGPTTFGKPCRVTAVTYPGSEGPVNIAREVEMSGPIHAKGVLILKGFLAARFAQRAPLCFGASLVFEQTYDAIDGDSASTTELYALLSSLSGVPIEQRFAVTGSVDQHGFVQPVGGLNEKIESFFDVCSALGLTGDQGVLIPARNLDALVLRADVAEAVARGHFHIYAIESVEEGIELLTGRPAGVRDEGGRYPDHTVYGAVQSRLDRFRTALKG